MKLVTAILAGILLLLPAARASAEPVDCEAARCTVQATIDSECPCAEAKNHGRYTACVSRIVNRLARTGELPKKCRAKIEGCAIRSVCGKRDGTVACQLPGSDVTSRCRPIASAELCTSRGGTIVESCCDSCSGPLPTATITATPVPTVTATETAIPVATITATALPEPTETPLPTLTPVATETAVPTETPVATETAVPTETPVPTETAVVPTVTATETAAAPTPTATLTATAVAPTVTVTATVAAPTVTVTATAVAPTVTVTATAVAPTVTVTATPVPTATRTATPTVTATVTATTTPTRTATITPTPVATPFCGDGIVNGSEQCEPKGAAVCPNAGNGLEFCSMNCTCDCPTRVTFAGNAADPTSILDTGWTGISHRAPVITNGDVTVGITCFGPRPSCMADTNGDTIPDKPCDITGLVPNNLPGQLNNRRCTNDTSIKCTSNAQCTGGTCEYYFGSPLSLAAGGVTTCVINQFSGAVSGTVNIQSGDANTIAKLRSRVFNGIAIDNPCPRCLNDPVNNDGLVQGTCTGGGRNGLACDGGGTIPGRPDFGTTSLDCPPASDGIIATLSIDLSSKTTTVAKTLTTNSPNCTQTGFTNDKCLCDTCNNANADPCFSNADCPVSGGNPGVCGGRRCLSGANNGAPCSANSACPGGACNRPGAPTQPSPCTDDTTLPPGALDCVDGDGDGEGECTVAPVDQSCSVASGHAQRGCTGDADCGGAVGSCQSVQRRCFLTGGGTFQPAGTNDGTDTLVSIGMADAPMNDVSTPTLAAVFCVSPTSASAVNGVAGLPGPGRVTIKGTAKGLP